MCGAEEDQGRDQDCKKERSNGADGSAISNYIVLVKKSESTVWRIFFTYEERIALFHEASQRLGYIDNVGQETHLIRWMVQPAGQL